MSEPEATLTRRRTLVPGFALCALGGVLLVLAQAAGVVRGIDVSGHGTRTYRFDSTLLVLGILLAVAFAALTVTPRQEWRIAGLGLAVVGWWVPMWQVIVARTDGGFRNDTPVSLLSGGKLALVASVVFVVGSALALLAPGWRPSPGSNPAVAVIVSMVGIIVVPAAGVGMGLGMRGLADDDHRRRLQSMGAVLVGVVAQVGWIVFFAIGAFTFNR